MIDDDTALRRHLVEQLARWGCHTRPVASAALAVAELRAAASSGAPWGAAIVNDRAPGVDGAELARQVRADPAIARTPLVRLATLPARGDGERAASAAAGPSSPRVDATLGKPLRARNLRTALARLLEGKAAAPEAPALAPPRTVGESPTWPRVLVAEDNPINQRVIVELLRRLGLRSELVGTGEEAVAAVAARAATGERYAVVFMDCQMPCLDGYEATARIRALEGETSSAAAPGRTPIVALTAAAGAEERRRCLDAGMDEFLSKPFESEDLQRLVRRFIPPAAPPAAV